MEPILLYGFPLGSSMGLVAALEWLGKPYRLSRVDMLGEMRTELYRNINARHETPALITPEGKVVTETMAIAAWFEARDKEKKISFDPLSPEADRMHQLMGFVNSSFTGAFFSLWVALEMEKPDPELQNHLRVFGRDMVKKRHDQLEEMINPSPYLVGEKPTLADALLIGVARWLDFHEVADAKKWPKLYSWRKRMEENSAVKFATALENGESLPGIGALKGQIEIQKLMEQFKA